MEPRPSLTTRIVEVFLTGHLAPLLLLLSLVAGVVALAALGGLYGSPLAALSGADLVGVARAVRLAFVVEQAGGAAIDEWFYGVIRDATARWRPTC